MLTTLLVLSKQRQGLSPIKPPSSDSPGDNSDSKSVLQQHREELTKGTLIGSTSSSRAVAKELVLLQCSFPSLNSRRDCDNSTKVQESRRLRFPKTVHRDDICLIARPAVLILSMLAALTKVGSEDVHNHRHCRPGQASPLNLSLLQHVELLSPTGRKAFHTSLLSLQILQARETCAVLASSRGSKLWNIFNSRSSGMLPMVLIEGVSSTWLSSFLRSRARAICAWRDSRTKPSLRVLGSFLSMTADRIDKASEASLYLRRKLC